MDAKTAKVFIRIGETEITLEGNPDFVTRQFRAIFGFKKSQKDENSQPKTKQRANIPKSKSPETPKAKKATKPSRKFLKNG